MEEQTELIICTPAQSFQLSVEEEEVCLDPDWVRLMAVWDRLSKKDKRYLARRGERVAFFVSLQFWRRKKHGKQTAQE